MELRGLRTVAIVLAVLISCGSIAPAAAQPVAAKNVWVRAPAPGQNVAGAYMELTAQAGSALVGVASPVAARAELHSTTMEDGVMKMWRVTRADLPVGQTVRLEPGGLHVMLVELKRVLKPGDKVPITLTVLRADSSRSHFSVQAEVRAATYSAPITHRH